MAEKEAIVEHTYELKFAPGIQRDGTNFAATACIDGQWVRFVIRNNTAVPRKIGGYKSLLFLDGKYPRGSYLIPTPPGFSLYLGFSDSLWLYRIDQNYNIIGSFDVTPVNFIANADNIWVFDRMFSGTGQESLVIAHAAPNLKSIDSPIQRSVFAQIAGSTAQFYTLVDFTVSGGAVALAPYLFAYGNNGEISYSYANNPNQKLNTIFRAPDKIVALYPTRGGNSSPAGLAWSLTSVIRITNTSSVPEFTADTISSDTSILSSKSIMEYDGRFYWVGLDRFLIYTGIIDTLQNNRSINYFFDNIDLSQRQKVWATKIPKYGEIWWFFPNKKLEGYNGECNAAVIYNVLLNEWYDSRDIVRSCGWFDPTFGFPIWIEGDRVWRHEVGVDKNIDGNLTLIPSWFESSVISLTSVGPGGQPSNISRNLVLDRMEPDFLLNGNMFLTINGKAYAQGPATSSTTLWPELDPDVTWPNLEVPEWQSWGDIPFGPSTEYVSVNEQRRQMTVKFISAEVGGDYEMGKPLLIFKIGDDRP